MKFCAKPPFCEFNLRYLRPANLVINRGSLEDEEKTSSLATATGDCSNGSGAKSGRPSQQQKPADTTLRDDTYAVYSAMLADPVTVYFVQGATVPLQGPPPPQICLPPTATNQADWRELLAELNQYKFSPETLSATFKTAKPVILLDDMEIAEFRLGFRATFAKL